MSTAVSQNDPSRLEALLESATLLHSSLDLDDLLRHLLRTVMGRLVVRRGVIAVRRDGELKIAITKGIAGLTVGDAYDENIVRAGGIEVILTIGDDSEPVGVLGFCNPPSGSITDDELGFVRGLLGMAASGISNAQAHEESRKANQDLAHKVYDLRTLLDLARGLASKLEPDAVASLLTLTLAGHWAIRKYALAAWREGHPVVTRQKGMKLPDHELLRSELAEYTEPARVADMPHGTIKSMLREQQVAVVLPLRSEDKLMGLVALGERAGGLGYSKSELEFGAGLVSQAEVAFENAWYVRETLDRKKMEQELALAASIQEGLFPESLPKIAGYDLAARNRPALQCGGDYYDVLKVDEPGDESTKFLLCVADVSGKGLPASLLMSSMQASLRALLGRMPSLVELVSRVNELLYASSPSSKFVTGILIEFDHSTGRGRFVSAGHNDCILLRRAGGEAELLKSTGLPIGMMSTELLDMMGKQYEESDFHLEPGDLVALYSDGVSEAYDEDENEWGEERFTECLRTNHDMPTSKIVDRVFAEIDLFAGSAAQHDDITLMILKREADTGNGSAEKSSDRPPTVDA